jgi:hypothetical protein
MEPQAVHASLPVILGTILCTFVVFKGVFDNNLGVQTGLGEYSEKPNPNLYGHHLIKDLKLPANALVNVGYTILGTYWVLRSFFSDPSRISKDERPSTTFLRRFSKNAFMTCVFGWMGVFYGPYQFLRITTQNRRFAVLDQWFTLPFFSWVFCWTLYCLDPNVSSWTFLVVMLLSMASYYFTFLSVNAFDVVLVVHILIVVVGALVLMKKYPNRGKHQALL